VRALEAVAVGNVTTTGSAPVIATIAMACRELRAWDGAAVAAAAAASGGVVSGAKQARKRKGKGGDSSEDEEEEEEGGARPAASKARPGNFFADLL
jgi:hypothetical protein